MHPAESEVGRSLQRRFGSFAGVGLIGAVIDFATFYVTSEIMGAHYVVARLAASFVALTGTWLLNRTMTFTSSGTSRIQEYVSYLMASSLGALANLAAFAGCIWLFPAGGKPLAYVIGAAVGMVVNFALYDRIVFRRTPHDPSGSDGNQP